MARTRIGVGSTAVRVAEVAAGDVPVIVRAAQVPLRPGAVEAVVDAGAHVTSICVHDRGATRFVLMLPSGGRDVTVAVAPRLGINEEIAETLKRGEPGILPPPPPEEEAPAAPPELPSRDEVQRLALSRATSFVDEIQSSLEFYAAQVPVLGVVAGLALIYPLFTTVLGGDDGGDVSAPTGPTAGVPTPSVPPDESPSPTPRETLPPVDLAGARDPFSIPPGLQTTPPGGGVSPTETVTPPTGAVTQPPSTSPPPTTLPPPTSPPPNEPPEPEPTDEISIGGHDAKLEKINNERGRLQITVDKKLWTVEEGAIFADNFQARPYQRTVREDPVRGPELRALPQVS